jgi:Ca2+:H+ antiporter
MGQDTLRTLVKPSLNWLLIFVPMAVGLQHWRPESHIMVFATACLAVLPLAGWLGRATEHLSARAGESIGGLLNATFGNAAELIIALMALRRGLFDVVKASLTGSIIGNILLVMGAAFLAGGLKFSMLRFNPAGAHVQSTLLTLVSISLIIPAAFHYLGGSAAIAREGFLSLEIAIVLLAVYALSLMFSMVTHRRLFQSTAEEQPEGHGPVWRVRTSVGVLAAATALIAWMSEILVASVEPAAHTLGMTNVFVGVIIVAVIGNAAEHSTAILVAMKNRMDLSLGIAIGSSIQIALFVAPVLVVLSYFLAPRPMDLVFSPAEVVAIGVSVLIAGQIASDGECTWFEGVLLLAVYLMLAIMFYFLPEPAR